VSGLNMIAARLRPGAISESNSSHLPPSEASKVAKPVVFPVGRSSRAMMPLATGSIAVTKAALALALPVFVEIFKGGGLYIPRRGRAAPVGLSRRDGSRGQLPLDPWHRGSADDCLHARRNGISERAARGAQTQSVLSAALNGWLRIIHRIIQGFHKRRNNVRISAKNLQKIYRTFSCLYTALQNHPRIS